MPESNAVIAGEPTPETSLVSSDHDASAPHLEVESAGDQQRPGGLWRFAWLLVLAGALAALVPTVGDFGLTWDEPAYRYGQVMSAQWWEQLFAARSARELGELFDPLTLLYYWPYGRFGICFHPPLGGQLNLAAYAVFGHWMKDIPARRMASVIEFALTVTIAFQFLARRYGPWVGVIAAGSLLCMPRLYGEAHLIDTDTPGLLLWAATALAFWKGLHEPHARRWRVAVGVLIGLAFVQKLVVLMVLLPLLFWLIVGHLTRTLNRRGISDWIDGLLTSGAMLVPLWLAFVQIQMLQRQTLVPPVQIDYFAFRPAADLPGAILAAPLIVWIVRRFLGRRYPGHAVWGVERPALEIWTAILAFAPVVGWLGNPAWWRETLLRLSYYYTVSLDREHVLPRIQIIYFGQIYEFSLPWHNGWVLMGITVPVAILATAAIGVLWAIGRIARQPDSAQHLASPLPSHHSPLTIPDCVPLYFLVHFFTLPIVRMFPTPAHDGVRLFLPTFFFLSAFAGWGTVSLADSLARWTRVPRFLTRAALAAAVVGSAAFSLVRIHPYELSYYNELLRGPRGAWERGFELSYWYDAFTDKILGEINDKLPPHAEVDFFNDKTKTSVIVFQEHQSLGKLRGDILLTARHIDRFPYVWLLTQDSKAEALTRLLFAMRPWYTSRPHQVDGARVLSVLDPLAVSRAWALRVLLDYPDLRADPPPAAPHWVRTHAPWLARLWGDGLVKARGLILNQRVLDWARDDPQGLLAAARAVASKRSPQSPEAQRLIALVIPEKNPDGPRHYLFKRLLEIRPKALVEGVEMLLAHRDRIATVMTHPGYVDPQSLGGYIDEGFENPNLSE
jgi:4-amino-4-deoxy-L-arabinose transferase-like glycosyltransferase